MKYELATSSWDQAELDAMRAVMDSGYYTMGQHVAAFEQSFANYLGRKYCVMVNSGSSANLIMIAALFYRKANSLQRGDEVIVPAVSWATTYAPLHQYGLHIKFVDIDRETLNFDTEALAAAITDRTRLILAVNLLGNSNDFDAINRLIAGRNIILLEDNCESLGGEWHGRKLGTLGLAGSFSTFFSHHMSTMEGGMVATDNEEFYHLLLSLRSHGWTRHLPTENTLCKKSDDPFEESFRFILPGYNVRPTELSGAIGCEQMKKLPGFIEWRRKNAAYFQQLFGNDPRFLIQREMGKSCWFGFTFVIRDPARARKDLIRTLADAGVETRPIVAGNFARKEVVRWFDYEIFGDLKNADEIDQRGFFVGNHQFDIRDRLDYLRTVLASI